jgi:glycosyltransferase involved in cell wall biosynthesis
MLLRAAARTEFREWHFHCVTKHSPENVPSNVTIHRNITCNSDDMLQLYRNADVFVLPTRADFAPTNSICEAMAMGLPVISTSVGGIGENVIDGETGYIVPVDDEERFAERLFSLGCDHELRLEMGRKARKLAEVKFNSAINARSIIELMKTAADGHKR